ncbi:IclR family transcriptional regulator [Variovorax sp. RA8]|uniref:IclR family transcriptional regulator n=1 Tax=Variovorax sp. (strain JCM 16519 / RA8) TaxID=662548 RepID=UPI0013160156|nr:IclR family transcriptional regulator C-terminal domain-containing protein [Variovorax sp. RA8]VTU28657.1 Acetate operon repressor [Variovorax sp. RA8]
MRRSTSTESGGAAQSTSDTGTVARIALLLRLAAEQRDVFSLKDIATSAGLPVPTVYRLLDLMAREGLIAQEGGRRGYRIGTELYRIGSLVKANTSLSKVIHAILVETVAEIDETCHFAQFLPAQLAIMFDASVESSHPLGFRWHMHKPLSLVWGASGRTVLAHLPEEKMDEALAAESKWSPSREPPKREELKLALSTIRELGYGFTRGQRVPEAVSVMAPVFDQNNSIYGALGFVIPEPRFDMTRLEPLAAAAKKSAQQLSSALGAPRSSPASPNPR